jgi:predicted TIM-barrel fold metal-dependent hydrolase
VLNITRRSFVASAAAATLYRVTPAWAALAADVPWAGEKVIDCHFHGRATDDAIIAHLDGAGITRTLLLAQEDYFPRIPRLRAKYPGRVAGWARGVMLSPAAGVPVPAEGAAAEHPEMRRLFQPMQVREGVDILTRAIHAGAKGFGETVGLVQADGPELQRLYAMAAEFDVPILMHFQEGGVPGLPRYGISGFSRIESMLRKFPKTRFVCHASDFWAHIDGAHQDGQPFPTGRVRPGGLSDRLLADYPNMYGDLSAPSGYIQLSRDPEFTAGFLQRHQNKLIFGSDCGCSDGRGGTEPGRTGPGAGAPGFPSAPPAGNARTALPTNPLAGKCVARELLGLVWRNTSRPVFRKLAWHNGIKTYRLPA